MNVSGKLPRLVIFGRLLPNQSSWPRCQIDSVRSNLQRSGALLHTSSPQNYPGQEWRKKHGKPANPNAYGQLTDGPDYSFLDGRPTPPGTGKIRRTKEQREIASKILELSAEVDFAVAHHDARVKSERERKDRTIASKLKPKGKLPPEVS